MASRLSPVQLGFGVKRGTKAAIHACRWYLHNLLPDKALLKLDFATAFNSLSRDELLQAVQQDLPELYPFVHFCYANSSHLCFRDIVLLSDEEE